MIVSYFLSIKYNSSYNYYCTCFQKKLINNVEAKFYIYLAILFSNTKVWLSNWIPGVKLEFDFNRLQNSFRRSIPGHVTNSFVAEPRTVVESCKFDTIN